MSKNLLIGTAMIGATIALIWASGARAEPEAMTGPFCKSADALEEGWQYFADHNEALVPDVLGYLNEKHGEKFCGFGTLYGERKEDVKTSDVGRKHWVSRVALVGIPGDYYLSFGDPMEAPPSEAPKS